MKMILLIICPVHNACQQYTMVKDMENSALLQNPTSHRKRRPSLTNYTPHSIALGE